MKYTISHLSASSRIGLNLSWQNTAQNPVRAFSFLFNHVKGNQFSSDKKKLTPIAERKQLTIESL